MMRLEVFLLLASGLRLSLSTESTNRSNDVKKPHIVFILADDLGWNDVSWNNPIVKNPHLEQLAKEGVILDQSYVMPKCSPTRSALLTGRYPHTLGRQHKTIKPKQATGLTIKRKLLPEVMKETGYSTHMVGKWHLGFCSWDYTPTSRGFDTFWGYYNGVEDYYSHRKGGRKQKCPHVQNSSDCKDVGGYDFRNNTEVEYSVKGVYSTYTFASYTENLLASRDPDEPMFLYLPLQSVHSPLQVPESYTKPFQFVKNEKRRIKLGMILAMDDAVGRIVASLKSSGHYNNTIIIFSTDNGGEMLHAGNNWPLRGRKNTLWEGGTRGVAFVHSPLLARGGVVCNELIHVTDWFPTIAALGGGIAPEDSHGHDQWATISKGAPSPRVDMVYNIDTMLGMAAGVRRGNYKLLVGNPGIGDCTPPPEGFRTKKVQGTDSQLREVQEKEIEGLPSDEMTKSYQSRAVVKKTRKNRLLQFQTTRQRNLGWKRLTLGELNFDFSKFNRTKRFLSNKTEVRLFHIKDDPNEQNNIALDHTEVVETLMGLLDHYMKDYVKPDYPKDINAGSPQYWNHVWSPGWCQAQ